MEYGTYVLDESRRACVLQALCEVCEYRSWKLLVAHVRMTHVHAIVDAESQPEDVMSDFKRYASRKLSENDSGDRNRKRWARHGSTRWLWRDEDVWPAMQYVVHEQGTPMALFVSKEASGEMKDGMLS